MNFWQKAIQKVKSWFSGGSSRKSTPQSSRGGSRRSPTYQSGRSVGGYRGSRSRSYNSIEEERRRRQREARAKASAPKPKYETKSIAKAISNSANTAGNTASKPASIIARKAEIDANREKAQKRLDELKKKRESKVQKEQTYVNARGDKVVRRETKSKRAQGRVGGTYSSDMKYRMEVMPNSTSFARGTASGLSLGASELAAKNLAKKDKDRAKAEKTYQSKKNKWAELGGEVAGSLVTFGGTAGATDKLGAKAVSKLAPRAAEKLAGKKFIQNSARRSINKALKKGAIEGAPEGINALSKATLKSQAYKEIPEELVKQVGKDRAKKIVNAIGSDVAQNLTTGAIYDINKASAEHEVGSKDWWKTLGTSAALNFSVTGGIAGVSAFSGGKRLAKEGVKKLKAGANMDGLASAGRVWKGSRVAPRIGESIEDRIARIDAERLAGSADNAAGSRLSKNYLRGRLKDNAMRVKRGSKVADEVAETASGVADSNTKSQLKTLAERKAKREGRSFEEVWNEMRPDTNRPRVRAEDLIAAENSAKNHKPTKSELRLKEIPAERKQIGEALKKARAEGDTEAFAEASDRYAKLLAEEKRLERNVAKADKARLKRATDKVHRDAEEAAKKYDAEKAAKAKGEEQLAIEAEAPNEQLSIKSESAKGEQLGLDAEGRSGEQLNLADEITEGSKANKAEQETLADKINASEENPASKATKKKTPKTAKQKKKAEAAERGYLDTVMRKREKNLNDAIRSETKGEYGYRRGEHTAAAHSSLEHAKRIDAEQKTIGKKLRDEGVAELFENDDNTFGIFKTANKAELDKAAGEAVKRVNDDLHGTVKRLRELDERLKADVTKNSALNSAEHVTLNDVADITAIRNLFDEAGETLPKEYEEAFAHIIEWQRTEAAQGLKAIDLFLKENDASYRRAFLTRDIDRYMRKVLHADDVGIADIKRSLDANHGEGYFDNMIKKLSEYTGAKNEAEFRKAYADFQAEIFMNTKPSVWDAINLWRHSFMLSSPKTGANNIIGNVMQRIMYRISDAVNMAGESIAQGINPEVKRTTALLKSSDQRKLARMYTSGRRGKLNLKNENYLKGFDDQSFADEINMVSDADVAEMMESSKYMGDIVKGLKYQPTTAGGKVKQGAVKLGRWGNEYVSLMLNEPDSWFVERNYRTALLKYLEANGINGSKSLNTKEGAELLKEARAYAKDVALENTYKKANQVVSFLEGLRNKGHTKGSGMGYHVGSIILDAELPYLKVPANLIINNFKYSPMGLAKGAVDAFKGITKGDAELLNMATRELSKGLTGTGMAMLGYMMFCRDQSDDDSWGLIANARDELKEYGVRDNSFKIGDHNFNIANMGIGSVQFLMGASLAEDLAENGETAPYQVVFDALNKTVDTVADMSLMENAVSLLDTFGNGGDYNATVSDRLGRAGTEIAGDYAAQFIPNPLRGVAKGITSADLDTGVNKGEDRTQIQRILERNANNFIQGVPIANEKILPHKVDTHGNLVNERTTNREKLTAVLNNTLNPLSPRKVHIPEADKEELKVTKENGKPFKPNGFDNKRKYEAKVGKGKYAEYVNLSGKEREQVARSAKNSGYDLTDALVKKGMFGDRLGDRAQRILANAPDDEEKAREAIFATPEWKNADNETKEKWLEIMYGQGTKGDGSRGVSRTRNREAYVEIQGNSDGDFRYQNDLDWHYQKKYEENGFEDLGIDKGTYADVVQAVYDYSHKWDEENQKNVDTPNSAKKVKAALLSIEGLTPEQRIAIYEGYRGKRNGFGWYDWDGVSGGSGYYRRGYRRYHRWGHGGGSSKVSIPKRTAAKTSKAKYKSMAATLPKVSSSSSAKFNTRSVKGAKVSLPKTKSSATTKIAPPKVKFKKYEV